MTHPARSSSTDDRTVTSSPITARAHEDLRCACGSLLARLVPDGVELKCRRCKRTVVIPLTGEGEGATI
jgi:phage FluMu protein Com